MTDDDPNEAYEVVPIEPGPNGPPEGWWTVMANVRYAGGRADSQRMHRHFSVCEGFRTTAHRDDAACTGPSSESLQ
jgi:hypothetical protein